MVEGIVANAVISPLDSLFALIGALGGLIAIHITIGIVNIILNRKRVKELNKIRADLAEIKRIVSKKKRN